MGHHPVSLKISVGMFKPKLVELSIKVGGVRIKIDGINPKDSNPYAVQSGLKWGIDLRGFLSSNSGS